MKKIKIFIALTLLGSLMVAFRPAPTTTEGIEWVDMTTALERAEKENKPIFVDVYTDWCGWCKKMDKATFADATVVEYVNQNYIAVKLNAEKSDEVLFQNQKLTNRQLAVQKFGVRGYPTIVLVSKDAQDIQAKPGFKKPGAFLQMLKGFDQNN